MIDLSTLFAGELVTVLAKILILVLIFVYFIISVILTLQVRSLRNIIKIASFNFSLLLQGFFLLHLILVISLFFLALAIL